jgi:hypothetical protein
LSPGRAARSERVSVSRLDRSTLAKARIPPLEAVEIDIAYVFGLEEAE